jgi:hypothetical protein
VIFRSSVVRRGYGHFFVEHTRGHHKDVATPEDPASARLGENIKFLALREVPGAWRRAWASETERLHRSGEREGGLPGGRGTRRRRRTGRQRSIVVTGVVTGVVAGVVTGVVTGPASGACFGQ